MTKKANHPSENEIRNFEKETVFMDGVFFGFIVGGILVEFLTLVALIVTR